MAHYALLDKTNTVIQVITGVDENAVVNNITDWEEFYSGKTGFKVLRTSYNTRKGVHIYGGNPFRGNYAGIGYTYNEELDAFIPPQPHQSWTIDATTYSWKAPISYPQDGQEYVWSEESQSWISYDGEQ